MSIKYSFITILICVLIFAGCDGCKAMKEKIKNMKIEKLHNTTIILDLSDRIIDEDQINRDTILISSIIRGFEEDFENGKFQIVIAPQKEAIITENDRKQFENLMFAEESSQEYNEQKQKLFSALKDVYSKAKFSEDRNAYKGADIWQAFEDLRFENDTNTVNNIFVLTDGYQYVSGNQAGLTGWKNLDKDLSNAKVMVFETNPVTAGGTEEFKRVQKAWYDWLKQGKCNNIFIEKNIRLNDVQREIISFIQGGKVSNQKDFDDVNINDSPGQVYKTIPSSEKKNVGSQTLGTLSEEYRKEIQELLKNYSNAKFEKIRQISSVNRVVLMKENIEVDFNAFKQKIINGELKDRKIYHIGVAPNSKISGIQIE